ncbi:MULTISPECIES: aspartate 1-decarboxylase [Thermoactinomyces]|jgi:aspartate 1-decarboxylase|uniref:Aspartate 1-decarboxylase n=1 Tax=Thermoactinomyces daqus TaxID=1329516 RepID=A0A7W2AH88_9BACL|nr:MULTISPECIES: aspartate 1-decarboxylase [Thermoactinomyces]MBA4542416.1 aspartate 1-decarboxylase [Thermoactinomyces daqus]MBH8598795.1 aspartate 1-decarboxylase [Thermoactinomyces sp. CICC 10523]MBH8604780.1 aspartate 1-decarboxylase [Thermoactinomyces sp. CICC 10522]MBH8607394.1 aspartate 1-decarboxylase [Thermoactinomyces sp. CICC 10521]
MLCLFCKGKIHKALVTEADLDYQGSITIDEILMQKANILPFEMVQINGYRTGQTWRTYAIPAPPGSGTICLNGPPSRLFQPGDYVAILSLAYLNPQEMDGFQHTTVYVDEQNKVTETKTTAFQSAHFQEASDGSI